MDTPYSTDPFAALEHAGWQRSAARYDRAWSGLTRLFVPHLLDATGIVAGASVLDVACGPGYVAEAARALGAAPIGVDFSSEMVRVARARSPDIEFREGNAEALEFADGRFDAVLINFGLLHFPQPDLALREARRVLRPGGRCGFTVWAPPADSAGARLVDEAIAAHGNTAVALPDGPGYFRYGDPNTCRDTLSAAGFQPESFRCHTVTEIWRVPTASFVFESERDAGVRTTALLARQTPQALEAIARRVETAVREFSDGDGFGVPYGARVAAATRA